MFSALALACGAPPMNEVRISESFTADEVALIETAVSRWCQVSEDTCLPVSVVDRHPNVVRLRETPSDWGRMSACASTYHGHNYMQIQFRPDCEITAPAMAHEMGHAMTGGEAGHFAEPGFIMSKRAELKTCITERDAEYICSFVGCGQWRGTCESGDGSPSGDDDDAVSAVAARSIGAAGAPGSSGK